MRSQVRLPLQVGTTASWSILRAALAVGPGAVLLGVGLRSLAAGPTGGGAALVGCGLLLAVYAVQHAVRAWRARPSDAVLDEQGVRFEGGSMNGVALAWTAVDVVQTQPVNVLELRLSLTRVLENAGFAFFSVLLSDQLEFAPEQRLPVRQLRLVARDGRTWVAATAEKLGEQQSLDALLGSLRAKLGAEPKLERPALEGVLTCSGCHAALAPAAEAIATCRFCGATTSVPAELHARVQAQLALTESSGAAERLVEQLLVQPGAARANAWLAGTAAGAALAWGAAAAPLFVAGLTDVGGFEVGVALVAGALSSIAVVTAGQLGLINRRALRLLTSSFGARAPADPRGGPECRRCRALLPASDRTLVGCAYCGVQNILGLDLRAHVAPAQEHQLTLEQLFASKQRQRSRVLTAGAVALVAGGGAALLLLASAVVASELAATRRACERGDAAACADVARTYSTGSTVAKDEVKAAQYDERACALALAEGCYRLSLSYAWGAGVPRDAARAATLRAKGCALGYQEACQPEP